MTRFTLACLVAVIALAPTTLALNAHPRDFADKTRTLLQEGGEPVDLDPKTWFREGLEGAVTKADWDRYTVKAEGDPPLVHVDGLDVDMIGFNMVTLNDRMIDAYLGIRYGKSTEGAGRFKYSVPADKYWLPATSITTDFLGDKCMQKSMFGEFGGGSEDCLFLNVYVPTGFDATAKLPVMMFIHGGSFTSGDSSMYMPTRLLDKDVILVVIHYRLGALGWLSLQNDDIPGNAGLSDQILAIEWTYDNIASFGGDPELITIFGQSAGSASVSMIQTINHERTEGKFSGVIAESGSSLEYWAIDPNPLTSAYIFGQTCDCPVDEDLGALTKCLIDEKTASELAVCTHTMVGNQRNGGSMGFEGTSPVVQAATVTDRLITMMPADYITNQTTADVPVMMGANRDEGSFVFGVMYMAYLIPNELVDNAYYLENDCIPDVLNAFGIQDQTKSLSNSLQEKYLPGVNYSDFESICPGMIDLTGVLFIKGGTYQVALQHGALATTDSYFYSFDFVSGNSIFDWMFIGADDFPFEGGVTHADELMYIFSLPSDLTDAQLLTSQRLVTLWTNFAAHRNPTPESDSENLDALGIPTWPKLSPDELSYILIQDDLTIEADYQERWTIEMDLATGGGTEGMVSQKSYDDLKKESDAYMATMIVFIVLFVVGGGIGGYFWMKRR